jgi:hypothetical protein
MQIDLDCGRTATGAQNVARFVAIFGHMANSRGVLLAGASLIAALALGAPGPAFAACPGTTTGSSSAKPPSTATGVKTGTTSSGSGSSGVSSCGVSTNTKTVTTGLSGGSLAGVHGVTNSLAGVNRSTKTTTKTANNVTHNTSGGAHLHGFHRP